MMKLETMALFALFVVAAFYLGYVMKPEAGDGSIQFFYSNPPALGSSAQQGSGRVVSLMLPAVDKDNNGALGALSVELVPGSGRLFLAFNENNPLVNPDTQASLKTALDLVKKLSGKDLHEYDVFYDLETQSDVIGGQSAGAAITVATLAAVKGDALRGDTLITGAVLADGSVGPVGRILAKAQAVKAAGYTTFIVPRGEGTQVIPEEVCRERNSGGVYVRECSIQNKEVSIADQTGLKIIEVDNVVDAYNLMKA